MSTRLHDRNRRARFGVAAFALALAASAPHVDASPTKRATPAWCGERCDAVVVDWSETAYVVVRAADGYADPLAAVRATAIMHLAMHDAVNAVDRRYASYAFDGGDRDADAVVAAASAAREVLARFYPAQQAIAQAELDKVIYEAGNGASTERGVALGRRAAEAVLAKRVADGSSATVAYAESTRPGDYRYTPGFDFVARPQWRTMQPFALKSPGQFRSEPPPALTSARYATDFNEVRAVGRKGAGARRTVDETQYASFWYEFSDIGWNRVARVIARSEPQDLWQRARTFAIVNAVLSDAYVAGWDSKFHYDFWRPYTAIRHADADGNPSTAPDAAWEPLLVTPPVQDYPSTHSALGAAAATAMAEMFGRDGIRFTLSSTSALPSNPTRTFESLSQAAAENADSRVKAGLHFRFATVAGLKLGEDIGRYAARTMLPAVD